MWSVLLSNIRFLWFLQSMFLISYLYQWCGFYSKPMQKSVPTVCLHCSFARLKNKHIGVLGTNVATISWLHWAPVSGYRIHAALHSLNAQKNWNWRNALWEGLDILSAYAVSALNLNMMSFCTNTKSRLRLSVNSVLMKQAFCQVCLVLSLFWFEVANLY